MKENENLMLVTIEECAEVQQALSKCLRFGVEDHHPDFPKETNEEQLLIEFYQLTAMFEELQKKKIINNWPSEKIQAVKKEKIEKVYKYMKYSKKIGIIEDKKE